MIGLFGTPLKGFSLRSPSPLLLTHLRSATKKAGGSSRNGRTSQPKYLGFKKYQGASVIPGNLILKQRGTQWHPGTGVGLAKDHTIFATVPGRVVLHFDLGRQRRYVSVDDGTLPPQPSKPALKAALVQKVDFAHYLSLTGKQRYDYVMELVAKVVAEEKERQQEIQRKQLYSGKNRPFSLVDLTLL